ncbi:SDR family NAD(P)-dependent oxidoreductase [Streptacidiphilus sp. PB12-B1b]|uniref:oxidoreductase n=1 Tax=Streptacidiphilus sp. PB12-B1b TaxID=2705012 RepID=UPI0015FCDEBC|nr:oxidoreductase [Streptacidiphilus sp. PB12-B1b]QMU76333.1 SDR family NAD(P)-dependent oxidoreductase [Streptacidiphilus sp. PB12-B1b]
MPWTSADVPDQSGRVALVTGANSGLGLATATVLAQRGATVVLACRNPVRAREAADRIGGRTELLELDLASLASVRAAAEELHRRHDRLDLLVNNAGVMVPPHRRTADGFELQLGTNHLGHFALTGLLLDLLRDVPGSRVVVLSSLAHRIARHGINFADLQYERRYNRVEAYAQSKLANLMFMYALQRRLAGSDARTIALGAHPGYSATELTRYLPKPLQAANRMMLGPVSQPPERGALCPLRAATDPRAMGGHYYGPDGPFEIRGWPVLKAAAAAAHDEAVQERLWTVSEQLTGVAYA